MKKIKFKVILLISIIPLLSFCAGAKEALEGKKRSDQSDEFLVKKKNPLQMPPDIDKLPMPGDDLQINTQEKDDVKKLLKIKDYEVWQSTNVMQLYYKKYLNLLSIEYSLRTNLFEFSIIF